MGNLNQKLEYLKWLKSIGVEYYFSEEKDSNISVITINKKGGKMDPVAKPWDDNERAPSSNLLSSSHGLTTRPIPAAQKLDSNIPTSRTLANNTKSLEELKEAIQNFNGCDLKGFATNTVIADGNPKAKIMLVGEAPGAKEDELGIPFCGESGMLLDTMLLTIGLSRKENIYITNTVFWRPPANRRPTNQEMEACRPFLEKHIALVNPKLIICVGSTAVNDLLGDKITISLARNNLYSYKNEYLPKPINTMAIFHPAYLLRQSEKKKDMWFDLIKIQQFIKESL